ncbi:hypothetical protein G6F68_015010 [Rhizopus microsporus]|nr:hypothetical protein G6F68_015010 [Rhizopus microsporus]
MRTPGLLEATLGFVMGQLEVVRNTARTHFHAADAVQLRLRPTPARLEDVDVEHRAGAFARAIVFQAQHQALLAHAAEQLIAAAAEQRLRGERGDGRLRGQHLALVERGGLHGGGQRRGQRLLVQRRLCADRLAIGAVAHLIAQRVGQRHGHGVGGAVVGAR